MAESITLRAARPEDTEFLVSLARQAYDEVLRLQFDGWDEAVHGQHFAKKVADLPFQVAELDGEPVATVCSVANADHLWLSEVIVHPARQNRGIGLQLLRRQMERARDAAVPLRLHTLRLSRALAFYERHGFVVTARAGEYVDLEWVP